MIAIGLLLSAVIVPVQSQGTSDSDFNDDDDATNASYAVTVQYIDSFGNPMMTMPFELIQNGGGEPVDHILIYASWEATGTNLDLSTLSVSVLMEIREYGQSFDYDVHDSQTLTSSAADSGLYFEVYEDQLAEIDDGQLHQLNIWCEFTATVQDTSGNPLSDTDTIASEGFSVRIGDAPGSMTIDGTITYDNDFNVVAFNALDVGDSPLVNPATAMVMVGAIILIAWVCGGKK